MWLEWLKAIRLCGDGGMVCRILGEIHHVSFDLKVASHKIYQSTKQKKQKKRTGNGVERLFMLCV